MRQSRRLPPVGATPSTTWRRRFGQSWTAKVTPGRGRSTRRWGASWSVWATPTELFSNWAWWTSFLLIMKVLAKTITQAWKKVWESHKVLLFVFLIVLILLERIFNFKNLHLEMSNMQTYFYMRRSCQVLERWELLLLSSSLLGSQVCQFIFFFAWIFLPTQIFLPRGSVSHWSDFSLGWDPLLLGSIILARWDPVLAYNYFVWN